MAIKIVSAVPVPEAGDNIFRYWFDGVAADTRPTAPDDTLGIKGIADQSIFRELDTGVVYTYSTLNANATTSDNWWEV